MINTQRTRAARFVSSASLFYYCAEHDLVLRRLRKTVSFRKIGEKDKDNELIRRNI